MNGRVYDYNLGRFLSVDPFIQSPGDSQSINPYSYIMNNPLAGTDPTGYCAAATGTRIKSCGDMKVEVKVTMKDGSTATKSSVVKDVNFKNGADVSSAMSKGAAQAGGQFSAADFNSQGAIAKQSPTQSSGAGNSQSHTTSQTTDQVGMPIDSDVWEYVGQTNGVNTFQTVHKRPDDRVSIGDVNDNFVTPAGLIAGYVERKTNGSKRRWSDRYRNHGKIWDGARLVGNYAFVAGSLITAGTTVSDIVDMRNSGRSVEDKVLRGIDGVADIGFGVAAFFGPVGWLAAATYYGADYLSGGNLTEFIYRGITGRREEEVSSSKQ